MKNGYFISFEGIDGSGKSTQIKRLKAYLEEKGYDVVVTREPGGTEIGEKIRKIILDPRNRNMSDMTEALLYAASRAQHVSEVILPAVEQGKIVICDRFVDSSIAYQGYGRKMGDCIKIINRYAAGGIAPDITFLMKLGTDAVDRRIGNRRKDRIELETEEFYKRVSAGYDALTSAFPERILSIDAGQSVSDIEKDIKSHVCRLMMGSHK